MCPSETDIVIGSESNQALVDQGETVVLPNGYRMNLTDIEAETQTALFDMLDAEGNIVGYADLVEGVEYSLTFPDGEMVSLSACSVRAGYTFGEKSVMLVADVDLEMEQPEPAPSLCEGDIRVEPYTYIYNTQIPGATQELEQWYCDGDSEYYRETSRFTPEMELEIGPSGYAEGLPEGRYRVNVLGEDYVLADADSSGIALAKESIAGIMNQGESLSVAGGLVVRLEDLVVESGAAAVAVVDSMGNVLLRDTVEPGQTAYYSIGGEAFYFHVYATAPGYTFGSKWADVAVFSEYNNVPDGGSFEGFSFSMSWTPEKRLSSWTLTRL